MSLLAAQAHNQAPCKGCPEDAGFLDTQGWFHRQALPSGVFPGCNTASGEQHGSKHRISTISTKRILLIVIYHRDVIPLTFPSSGDSEPCICSASHKAENRARKYKNTCERNSAGACRPRSQLKTHLGAPQHQQE